jgi:hypothetical protein
MKRARIPLKEQLAAALSCLLPQEHRDGLRKNKVPADTVIRLFTLDHIGLHCFNASDKDLWHNLNPMLRQPHAEKSRIDSGIAAKVKRIAKKHQSTPQIGKRLQKLIDLGICDETGDALPGPTWSVPRKPKISKRVNPWPKGRKIPQRKQS